MKIVKLIFILFLLSFIFSCAENKEIVVKYKNVYNFSGPLKLECVTFKPIKNDIAIKTKNTLSFKNRKYSFYSVIYNFDSYCRIFSYALFGKRVEDILFDNDKIYFVLGNEKKIYVSNPTDNESLNSMFCFLKDIIKGITLKNVYLKDNCYWGKYKIFIGKVCKNDGFNSIMLYNSLRKISVRLSNYKNGLAKRITIEFGDKKLKIEVKKILKIEKDPKKLFLKSTGSYKKYYILDLIKFEKILLNEK